MFDATMQNYMHCFFDLFGNLLYFDILKKEPKLDFLRVILVGEHEGVKVISEFNSDNK